MNDTIHISPDTPRWFLGPVPLNATIVHTWIVMAVLTLGAWLITRRLSTDAKLSRGQNLLEVLVQGLKSQIREVSRQDPGPYLPFVGTLFVFILTCNVLAIVPGFRAPTSSLSTTAALAFCVFLAVPIYGIAHQGLGTYLRQYIHPSPLMLPFNVIGELSRTLALAVRLYGNMMSGAVIAAILLGFAPLFVPVLMQSLGLLTGVIQAYIFAILAMVYIASATQVQQQSTDSSTHPQADEAGRDPKTPSSGQNLPTHRE